MESKEIQELRDAVNQVHNYETHKIKIVHECLSYCERCHGGESELYEQSCAERLMLLLVEKEREVEELKDERIKSEKEWADKCMKLESQLAESDRVSKMKQSFIERLQSQLSNKMTRERVENILFSELEKRGNYFALEIPGVARALMAEWEGK
jgi:hypothetical protein